MPVTGASGSKSNPGGKSGTAAGQSSGKSFGGRGGNVNQQGSRQARQGSLGTTKAQVNAGVLGQKINSPLSTPFSRAGASLNRSYIAPKRDPLPPVKHFAPTVKHLGHPVIKDNKYTHLQPDTKKETAHRFNPTRQSHHSSRTPF